MMTGSSTLSLIDDKGCKRIASCRPVFSGVERVDQVTSGVERRLYHAGPPIVDTLKIAAPLMNSLCLGAIYEAWANDYDSAAALILSGDVEILAAQDHDMVIPLAGVLSPSMAILKISDANNLEQVFFAAINEGNELATRLGKFDLNFIEHLKWLNGSFARWLGTTAETPIDLLPIIKESLLLGDDCHARTLNGSKLIHEALFLNHGCDVKTKEFLNESGAFALNFWMGAAGLCLAQASGLEGCSIVTKVGSNGHEFGIQIAGNPGKWIVEKAPVPVGQILPGFSGKQALPAIGDSTVVDFLGLGGQCLSYAVATLEALKSLLPVDTLERTTGVLGSHFDAIGLKNAATSARQCCASRKGPIVLIGMIDKSGESGRIGGGFIDVPHSIFCQSLKHLD